jgi:hypothetical protein
MHCEGRWMADPRMLPELLRRLALRLLGTCHTGPPITLGNTGLPPHDSTTSPGL